MAGIALLSPELLELVFDYVVGDTDKNQYSTLSSTFEVFENRPSTVCSLLLVSKSFNATAQRIHNRRRDLVIRQDIGDSETEKTMDFLSRALIPENGREILRSIHEMTITCHKGRWKNSIDAQIVDEPTFQTRLNNLATIVAQIPNLRNLTFTGTFPIPISLLHALEKHHPKCHLHIRDWHRTRDDADHTDVDEIALAKSPNLRSITAELWGGGAGLDMRTFALRRIVQLSPHLENVDIREGMFGCLIRSYTDEETAEMKKSGALFTAGSTPSPNNIKSLKSRGGKHVEFLEDVTDLRKLEILYLGWVPSSGFFVSPSSGRPRFEALKHLSVKLGFWYEPGHSARDPSLQDFLASCPPLESLHISDRLGRVDLSTILANHGHSLRGLNLHESERVYSDEPTDADRYCLSLDEIREVRERCPGLQEFSVDLDRYPFRYPNRDSTKEVLRELAKFEKLGKIVLHFPLRLVEISSMDPASSESPQVHSTAPSEVENVAMDPFNRNECPCWLENIFSFLKHQKIINRTAPLTELHVKLGEWEREPPMGLPASWECFEGKNKRCFVLKQSERDDCKDKVEIRTLRLLDIFEEKSVKEERELRSLPGY